MHRTFVAAAVVMLAVSSTVMAQRGSKERVEFENGKSKLVGDLLLPKGDGPHPVFVVVHGSGAIARDCGGYYVPIWERLLKQGYAVLSWDKPGVGESSGDWKTQSMSDRTSEVKAALAMVKKRKEIDPKRVSLWGTSQAGYVVPEIVAGGADISSVILVSPAHATLANTVRYELASEFTLRFVVGVAKEDVKEATAFVQEMLKMADRRAPHKEVVAHIKAAEAKPFFKPLAKAGLPTADKFTPELYEKMLKDAALDPRPSLEKMTCPMLVIFASEDKQVDPVAGKKTYEEAAKKAKNPDFRLVTIAGADHNLRIGEAGKRRIAPESLDLMEGWVAKRRR